ncbi:MAG: diguanylate cyclase [Undibacterium sp.]|uniref:GGDEF domain-containing protein n=1 Tax=Undibacterium sp. TaxID=1914977 RepID=UPI002722818B|nr:diguanylate cyclase [Undibacterium sp.]MDO8653029.1 diguanylate cyclase [Undibacterium sp.]
MTTQLDRSNPTIVFQTNTGFEASMMEKYEVRARRLERLGVRLFGVANCLVSFGNLSSRFDRGEHSIIAFESRFCDSLPFPDDIVVVPDTKLDTELAVHPLVMGAPFIRFYAAYPVFDPAKNIVGSVSLIDYQPRDFDDECRQILADLVVMVEREMILNAMHQTQLELLKQNRNLKRDSLIDPILGTWNKGAIIRSLRIEMERCSKSEKPLSLLFVTLDQIELIHDAHGIAVSDMLLIKMVSRIRSCIRPFDALGRFGNDIFLMVLPGASHLVATAVAERIRLTIMSHPEVIEEKFVELTISAGVVSTDTYPDIEPEVLISYAEKALLSARSAGNNRVVQAMPVQPDITI